MMVGEGPHGNLEMGGMFTLIKVRDGLARGDFSDPGWYPSPKAEIAHRVSRDADFGSPVRRGPPPGKKPTLEAKPVDHSTMKHG